MSSRRPQVLAAVAAVLGIDPARIEGSMGPRDIESWDSLASLRIVAEVEGLLGRRLDLRELARIQTIGDLLDLADRAAAGDRDD